MAESGDDPKVNSQPPHFLEVNCEALGKISRFAPGSKAGFAVSLINRKLGAAAPSILFIEAVKDGEDPIFFGSDAVLVDYGSGWKLQTVTEFDYVGIRRAPQSPSIPTGIPGVTGSRGPQQSKTIANPGISTVYIAKILLAFVIIFVLGAIFTLALENLPRFILFLNSLM